MSKLALPLAVLGPLTFVALVFLGVALAHSDQTGGPHQRADEFKDKQHLHGAACTPSTPAVLVDCTALTVAARPVKFRCDETACEWQADVW